MRRKISKVLSVVLCAVLVIGIVPINSVVSNNLINTGCAFFENLGGFLNKILIGINVSAFSFPMQNTTIKPTIVYDEETNTLTISGDGNLFEYAPESRPWVMYAETCENLIVDSGITRLGSSSFLDFKSLKSVTLKACIGTIKSSTFENCISLESIVIPYTVTKISADAFKNCTSLKTVVLSQNLVSLSGFTNCTALESIYVPDSVESLGGFDGCTSLKSINVPVKLKTIYDFAFRNCTALESFYLPDTLCTIGKYAFQNTNVFDENLVVPDTVTKVGLGAFSGYCFKSIKAPFVGSDCTNGDNDADIYNLAYWFGSVEYKNTYEHTYSKTTYYVPESLKSITLTKFLYPDNFRGMKFVEEIIIADTVADKSYPDCFAFGCSSLRSVFTNTNKITAIEDSAFRDCDILESFVIPENVKIIRSYSFYGCESLKNIKVPNTVETIGVRAFSKCENLESFAIPTSIKSIGDFAFENSSKLLDVTFPGKDFIVYRDAFFNTAFLNEYKGDFVIVGDGVLLKYIGNETSVVVPDIVKRISASFYNCSEVTEILLPDSLRYISMYSFEGCNELKSLYIPDSVIEISQNAFYGMSNGLSLSVPFIGKNRNVVSGNADAKIMYWFNENNKKLSSFSLREGVAFAECGKGMKITTLNIEAGVQKLMDSCFSKAGIVNLNISPNVKFSEIPNFAFSGNLIESLIIPGVIKVIGDYAFSWNEITSLDISEGVEEIKASFDGALVTEVILPDSLLAIKANAFSKSINLEKVVMGKNVSIIEPSAFSETNINEFIISSENPYFFSEGPAIYNSEGALHYYHKPEEAEVLYIGEKVTYISDKQLKEFKNLTEYKVDENNKVYKSSRGILYKNSGDLLYNIPQQYNKDFNVTKDVKEISSIAFYNVTIPTLKFIEDIELEKGLLESANVENLSFYNLSLSLPDLFGDEASLEYLELKSLTITNQKDDIPENLAYKCKIDNVAINGSTKKLGDFAFGLGEFKKITLPDSLKVIGDNAFNNTKLESVYLGKSLEHIGYASFYFCNVPEIKLPPTLLTIGNSAFFGTKFTNIILGDKIKEVGEYAFSGSSLKKAVINEKIVEMSDMIFQNCKDLEIVVVGSQVVKIGELAFQNCNHLNTVVIPDSVTKISEDAFSGANKDVVIFCNPDSYAQSYAEKYNIKYTTLVLDSISNQVYTSEPIEPEVNAKANNKELKINEEYTLSYSDNINVGRAKITAKGIGDFKNLIATAHFEILSRPVSDVVVTSYDILYHPKGNEPKISLYIGENKLVQGVDYEILDNGNNVKNVGTYNVTVKGIGNLTGTYNTTYEILQRSISVTTIKSGDELVVTDSGYTLAEGKDYIIENRVAENGNEEKFVVGIGNYTDEKLCEEQGDFIPNILSNVIKLVTKLLKLLFSLF